VSIIFSTFKFSLNAQLYKLIVLWCICCRFDVVVIGGAIIATMVEAIDHLKDLEGQTLDIILVIRVLRLVKLVNGFDR